jgi:Tol biopolymer transport system component
MMTLDAKRRVRPLVETRLIDQNGAISPDGRWLAYDSNPADRFEIYVRPS